MTYKLCLKCQISLCYQTLIQAHHCMRAIIAFWLTHSPVCIIIQGQKLSAINWAALRWAWYAPQRNMSLYARNQ